MNRHILSVDMAARYGVSVKEGEADKLLSPNDIGKILGVTGEAVKHWIYRRRLPAVKTANGYWKVKVSDFEHFLSARHHPRFPVFVEAPQRYEKVISEAGYEVITAQNLCDAMLKLAERPPAMFVLDIRSKNIRAMDLLDWRLRIKAVKRTPAVVIGELPDGDLERALKLGVIAAAGDAGDVLKAIESVFGKRQSQKPSV